ncbi:MAG TPA: DUF1269 domain-containing protein [Baekduia sp.]|jgi:uncharacterized membrane protein
MSNLIAVAYPDMPTAERVAANLDEARKGHLLDLDDLVLVEHRDNGEIKLHQPSMAGAGALGGAAWGGLIGLLFLVPFFGMAIGAATGAAAGAMSDAGVDDKFMKDLGEQLQPGNVAVVALVHNANMEKLLEDVKIPGTIIHSSLDDETETALAEALSKAGASAA